MPVLDAIALAEKREVTQSPWWCARYEIKLLIISCIFRSYWWTSYKLCPFPDQYLSTLINSGWSIVSFFLVSLWSLAESFCWVQLESIDLKYTKFQKLTHIYWIFIVCIKGDQFMVVYGLCTYWDDNTNLALILLG